MSIEEEEKENLIQMINHAQNDDMTIKERVEELEDRFDYIDIPEKKKKELKQLCEDIKKETSEKTQEFLFKQIIKIIEE